jgi:hypothetical protein
VSKEALAVDDLSTKALVLDATETSTIENSPIFAGKNVTSTEDGKTVADNIKSVMLEQAETALNISENTEDASANKILESKIYDVTYTNAQGTEQNKEFDKNSDLVDEKGNLIFTLGFPDDDEDRSNNNYIVAHLVMHSGTNKDGTIEYIKPTVTKNGLVVKVSSLSLFVVMKTSAAVDDELLGKANKPTTDETPSGTISGSGDQITGTETPTTGGNASVAKKADDNTGTIILIGAVAATAVVGGVIAYNWDKLPVHKIEGTVVDANGAAVANATVEIAKDGKVVKTVTTDANGYYTAKVAKGEYTITATVGEASTTAEGSTGTAAQLAIA